MIIGGVAWYAASRGSGATAEVIPPGVTGQTTVQAAAHQVPNTSGTSGISVGTTLARRRHARPRPPRG